MGSILKSEWPRHKNGQFKSLATIESEAAERERKHLEEMREKEQERQLEAARLEALLSANESELGMARSRLMLLRAAAILFLTLAAILVYMYLSRPANAAETLPTLQQECERSLTAYDSIRMATEMEVLGDVNPLAIVKATKYMMILKSSRELETVTDNLTVATCQMILNPPTRVARSRR